MITNKRPGCILLAVAVVAGRLFLVQWPPPFTPGRIPPLSRAIIESTKQSSKWFCHCFDSPGRPGATDALLDKDNWQEIGKLDLWVTRSTATAKFPKENVFFFFFFFLLIGMEEMATAGRLADGKFSFFATATDVDRPHAERSAAAAVDEGKSVAAVFVSLMAPPCGSLRRVFVVIHSARQ